MLMRDMASVTCSKYRGRGEGVLTSAGAKDPGQLRLCPTLEARIMDLRQDNTAFAQFLSKVNKVSNNLTKSRLIE